MSAGSHYSKLFGLKTGVKNGDHCLKCGKQAAILLPYGPQRFCKEHFSKLIESRFKRTVRRFSLIKPGEHLAIALSGGKDSVTALHLTAKFFSNTNKVTAVLINEGIPGYRNQALKAAKKNCKKLGVPFREFSFRKEFGLTMKEIQGALEKNRTINLGSPCTFCGTLRRSLLNRAARSVKADKLVTGHNLDDETQSILMNACDNDLARFVRSGAGSGFTDRKNLVRRIKPLCEIPEREVFFYAQFNGISFYSGKPCPFREEAKRNNYRSVLNQLEEKYPGTKYSLWQFFNQVKPLLVKEKKQYKTKLNTCDKCGEPCSGKTCEACKKLASIQELSSTR